MADICITRHYIACNITAMSCRAQYSISVCNCSKLHVPRSIALAFATKFLQVWLSWDVASGQYVTAAANSEGLKNGDGAATDTAQPRSEGHSAELAYGSVAPEPEPNQQQQSNGHVAVAPVVRQRATIGSAPQISKQRLQVFFPPLQHLL